MKFTLAMLLGVTLGLAVHPAAAAQQDKYCLQGRGPGYPGNCQFSSYRQCMATASGTEDSCGINPQYAFARQGRRAPRNGY